jgi:hypothetical protein
VREALGKRFLGEQTAILVIKFTLVIGINVLRKEGGWDSHRICPIDDNRHGFDASVVKRIPEYDPDYKRWGARQNQGLLIAAEH